MLWHENKKKRFLTCFRFHGDELVTQNRVLEREREREREREQQGNNIFSKSSDELVEHLFCSCLIKGRIKNKM